MFVFFVNWENCISIDVINLPISDLVEIVWFGKRYVMGMTLWTLIADSCWNEV